MTVSELTIPAGVQEFLARGRSRLLIDGEWTDASDGGTLKASNPADGTDLLDVAKGTREDVDRAVAAARNALGGEWRRLAPAARGALISRLGDAVEAHREELAVLEVLDTGKPLASALADVDLSLATLRYFAGSPARLRGVVGATTPDKHSYVRREPIGVAGLITAWNFPLVLATWKIAPALAAGVTFVLKPAAETSLSSIRLAELAVEAGIPSGVFNLVTGSGSVVGDAIVRHRDVAKISFTGSTEVGQGIQAIAAASSKRVTLELGGKSPNIIFADADIDAAISAASLGAFANAGQVCCSGNRLFVESAVLDRVLEGLGAQAKAFKLGNGLDPATTMGPMVSAAHFKTVSRYLAVGREAGYQVVAGGQPAEGPGYFIQPTVFAGVGNDDTLAQEEVFGPVLTVTAFDTEEDAVRMANDSRFGLAAGVWTKDLSKAHRVAAELEAGTVWVNTFLDIDPALPYGGFKESGMGRDLGDASVESFTELKTVVVQL